MSKSEKSRLQKVKSRYNVIIWIIAILCFVLGVMAGIFVQKNILSGDTSEPKQQTVEATPEAAGDDTETDVLDWNTEDTAVQTPEPETDEGEIGTEASEEPTATPEPTPEPVPVVLETVKFGDTYTFNSQIDSTGVARLAPVEGDAFENLKFSIRINDLMLPDKFASIYGDMYPTNGTEAGVEFELTMIDYTGTAVVVPQNVLNIKLISESGETVTPGYQLMDAMVSGNVNVSLMTNTPTKLYKRFDYVEGTEAYKYLLVEIYNDGVMNQIKFELQPEVVATPEPEYTTLRKTDKSDAVAALQTKLIELGYLEGDADGDFGSKTENAIKAAQKDMGMEETGEASSEFQAALFAR